MTLQDAFSFLSPALQLNGGPQHWADLGCGSGLFTQALAHLLPAGSSIQAVDKRPDLKIAPHLTTNIHFLHSNFERDQLPFGNLDGILMANALHYVASKKAFVAQCKTYLKPSGGWVVIEYEASIPNPWVPYPISFQRLAALFQNAGYSQVHKVNERPSVFRSGGMYCAVVKP